MDYSSTLRKILANTIGSLDQAKQLGLLNPSLFPDTMANEKTVLAAVLTLRDQDLPPTEDAVVEYLNLLNTGVDYRPVVEELRQYRTDDTSVAPYVFAIKEAIGKQRQLNALAQLKTIYEGNQTLSEKYTEALPHIRKLTPRINKGETKGFLQAEQDWWDLYAENIKKSKAGKSLGPRLPWENSWNAVPYMRPQEVMVIAGKRGAGKSTLSVAIGIDLAHVQGYDVLFCHNETDRNTFMSRLLAREFMCPVADIEQGFYHDSVGEKRFFDLREEPYVKRVNKVREQFKLGEKNGKFLFHHCPGASVEDIALDIQLQQELSKERGRELVVVLDYFQNLRWDHYKARDEVQGLNTAANVLKDTAEALGVNWIVFAQDTLEDDSSETDRIRSANTLGARSQTVIKIVRERAEEDRPMRIRDKETQKEKEILDMHYRPIMWHRKGEWSARTFLKVVKSNNGSLSEHDMPRLDIAQRYFYIAQVIKTEAATGTTNS